MIAWLSTPAATASGLWLLGIALLVGVVWEIAATIAWGPQMRAGRRWTKTTWKMLPPGSQDNPVTAELPSRYREPTLSGPALFTPPPPSTEESCPHEHNEAASDAYRTDPSIG